MNPQRNGADLAQLEALALTDYGHCTAMRIGERRVRGLSHHLEWLSRDCRAQRGGFDDVLFTDAEGLIAEAATSNIGFIDGDRIVWPHAERLAGVTMRLVSESHDGHVATEPVTLGQLADVDAIFATNATTGIRADSSMQWPADHPALGILRKEYARVPTELV